MISNGMDILISKMTFANLRSDQRKNAIKNTTVASQTAPRTKNRLSALRDTGATTGQKKAYQECLCTTRTIDGKKWLSMSPDCLTHGVYKENLAFERKASPVEGAGRDGRKKAHSY